MIIRELIQQNDLQGGAQGPQQFAIPNQYLVDEENYQI